MTRRIVAVAAVVLALSAFGGCATATGTTVTEARRTFNAEASAVVSMIANRMSAAGYTVREATPYRILAEAENNSIVAQALLGTQASGYRVVNRLDCNVSSQAGTTTVVCHGGVVSNPGTAFERLTPGANLSAVQASLDNVATSNGW